MRHDVDERARRLVRMVTNVEYGERFVAQRKRTEQRDPCAPSKKIEVLETELLMKTGGSARRNVKRVLLLETCDRRELPKIPKMPVISIMP